jgi:hypothetical protein
MRTQPTRPPIGALAMNAAARRARDRRVRSERRARAPALVVAALLAHACASDDGPVDRDGGADDSGTGGIDADVSLRKRVFYFRNGTLGKIRDSADLRPAVDVADEDCTRGANEMGASGTWRAWLSSSEIDAIDRIADVGPWYRVDQETLLFPSKADLLHGPAAPIDLTFDDPASDADVLFWSGTAIDGRRTSDNCMDWTIYNLPAIATVGRADIAGEAWVAADPLLCSNYLALLCIEQ